MKLSTKGNTALKNANGRRPCCFIDEDYTDEMTADRVRMDRRGIEELRQRFVEEGV
jgi:hypothetical protein